MSRNLGYKPLFDSETLEQARPRPPGEVNYLYEPDLELAINVALATRRPLLLAGLPGTGKSTLAKDVAWKLNRRFYDEVITSRTRAQDLQWSFDTVQRFSDAAPGQGGAKPIGDYVKPGVLWWAFNSTGAAAQAPKDARAQQQGAANQVVVLLDEIDKAEPDIPNDLLVVLDSRSFVVQELGTPVKADDKLELLMMITTNGERALPPAFVRRCVKFTIQPPDPTRLHKIAERHFDDLPAGFLKGVYAVFKGLRETAAEQKLREPSTAELLDAVRACARLHNDKKWSAKLEEIAYRAMWKHDDLDKRPGSDGKPAPQQSTDA